MRALALSIPVTVVSAERFRLTVVPGLRTAWIESDWTGMESGRSQHAEKAMYGYEVGPAVAVPITRWPLELHLGGHVGALRPFREDVLVDGYSPFEEAIGFRRPEVGASLR